jgi:hypothetical protein
MSIKTSAGFQDSGTTDESCTVDVKADSSSEPHFGRSGFVNTSGGPEGWLVATDKTTKHD